jgi:hypothetical protein
MRVGFAVTVLLLASPALGQTSVESLKARADDAEVRASWDKR